MGFSALATNLKVRSVPSISLLSYWNHKNKHMSETHNQAVSPLSDHRRSAMNLAHQKHFKAINSSTKYFLLSRKAESYMTNSNLIQNDFKILLISLPLLTVLSLS